MIFAPVYIFQYLRNFKTIFSIIVLGFIAVYLGQNLLAIAYNEFISKGMISTGAIFRSIPLGLCCFVYIIFRKNFYFSNKTLKFISDYFCLLSIFLILLTLLSPNFSAIADRLSYFMVIFQITVISLIFIKIKMYDNSNILHYGIFISVLYFLFTFSWFVFGDYSIYWLKYNFMYFK